MDNSVYAQVDRFNRELSHGSRCCSRAYKSSTMKLITSTRCPTARSFASEATQPTAAEQWPPGRRRSIVNLLLLLLLMQLYAPCSACAMPVRLQTAGDRLFQESFFLGGGGNPPKLTIPPPNGCQIVRSESFFSAGTINNKYIAETFF